MTSQAWQDPVHAALQQNPSMHWLFWQSAATLHAAPMGPAVVHWLVLGLQFGAAAVQSALLVHAVRHAVIAELQPKPCGQMVCEAAAQVPMPSQRRARVSVLPVQDCGPQLVVFGANRHAAVAAVVSVH
jgi:hypothetical protein